VIGNGSINALGEFAHLNAQFVDLYTDPSLKTYQTLGLRHGLGGLSGWAMIPNAVRAMKKGHRQGKTKGDPLQQGGICVVDTSGTVLFSHRDKTGGDHLSVDGLLQQLESTGKDSI